MKSKITFYASVLMAGLFFTTLVTSSSSATPRPQQAGVSFSAFYDALSPYGQWMNYGNYGQVWVPDAGSDFRPYYTNGHWVYTDYGWTWMSDYPWGWAPFHYGRWTYDNYYGWIWIPGEEWGPAWVSWRNNADYYGWAPLTPGVSVGVSVSFGMPSSYWSFVPCRYISSPYINRYYVDRGRNVTIINNTTVINNVHVVNNNTRYYRGPEARDVERITRDRITPVRVVNSDRPGASLANNQLRIFRPQGAELRRPLADNNRRVFNNDNNNGRINPAPNNNNVNTQPGTPGRTIRRTDDNGNNRVNTPTPNNNNSNFNRPNTPEPDRNTNTPRRIFNNEPENRVTPAPNNNPAPDRNNNMPRRIEPNRGAEFPAQPRTNPAPQPQQRVNPMPQPQRSNPMPQPQQQQQPQRSFSRPEPAPRMQPQQQQSAPRVMQQPSAPRQQSAPQPQRSNNNGRINRDNR